MFEEVILENSTEQIAKLYNPAAKANDAPDTGVEILKKAAYYVIRDCAKITREYLPLHVWLLYKDPLTELKGKFARADVEDFLKRAVNNTHANALKKVIVSDIKVKYDVVQTSQEQTPKQVSIDVDDDDIYGAYDGYDDDADNEVTVVSEQEELSDDELIKKYIF